MPPVVFILARYSQRRTVTKLQSRLSLCGGGTLLLLDAQRELNSSE